LLSKLGIQFNQLTYHFPALLPEAMHCLLYTLHAFDPAKRFSWAYARVVDALWESDAYVLDGQATARLVGMVVEEASQAFGVPIEKIAFSRDEHTGRAELAAGTRAACNREHGQKQLLSPPTLLSAAGVSVGSGLSLPCALYGAWGAHVSDA
jgi:hypothetical protein